jgi:hypothetical protein
MNQSVINIGSIPILDFEILGSLPKFKDFELYNIYLSICYIIKLELFRPMYFLLGDFFFFFFQLKRKFSVFGVY